MTEKIWLSSYPEEVPHHIEYEKIPVYQFLTRAYEEVPGKSAIHFMGKEITYKEL